MSTYTDASLIVTPNSKKAGKLYSLKGADLDVVRATTATYVGSDGLIKTALANEVRFDYTNGSCPSILVEPQRTNLLLYSEGFENGIWGKSNTIITSNTTNSPTGVMNADTYSANGVNSIHLLNQGSISVTSGITYTLSFFAKKNTNNFIQILGGDAFFGNTQFANFDLNLGVVGSVGSGATAKIESYENDWYRCMITINATSTGNGLYILNLITSATSPRLQTNTLSTSIFIWGAQLEAGSNATSYIPTTSSAVTRNADVISKTGISSLIGQTEGTIFIDFNLTKLNDSKSIVTIDNGSTLEYISLFRTGANAFRVRIKNSLGSAVILFDSSIFNTGRFKIAINYKNADYSLYVNGVLEGISTNSTNYPTTPLTQFILSNASYGQLNDSYNSVVLWKTKLTDQQCIDLTTL